MGDAVLLVARYDFGNDRNMLRTYLARNILKRTAVGRANNTARIGNAFMAR